jgi:hypothetical protein
MTFSLTLTQPIYMGRSSMELYMEQPEGYAAPRKGDWVWRLKKGLNGLVQAGRTWNKELNSRILSERLAAATKNPAVYVKNS